MISCKFFKMFQDNNFYKLKLLIKLFELIYFFTDRRRQEVVKTNKQKEVKMQTDSFYIFILKNW